MQICIFTEPQQGASGDTQLAHAQRTEALGFDGWFSSDHGGRLVGTPAQVVEKAAGLVALGAQRLYLQTMDMTDLDHLDLIAAEVLPHLA